MIETCWSPIEPSAAATPSTASTWRRTDSGNGGGTSSKVSMFCFEVTTASTPSFDWVKI